jgi:hypothetical protein
MACYSSVGGGGISPSGLPPIPLPKRPTTTMLIRTAKLSRAITCSPVLESGGGLPRQVCEAQVQRWRQGRPGYPGPLLRAGRRRGGVARGGGQGGVDADSEGTAGRGAGSYCDSESARRTGLFPIACVVRRWSYRPTPETACYVTYAYVRSTTESCAHPRAPTSAKPTTITLCLMPPSDLR